MSRSPAMRQQFIKLGDGMIGDRREYITKPSERIDFHQLARSHKAAQHRRGFSAAAAAEKAPVIAAHRETAQRPLSVIVIDR